MKVNMSFEIESGDIRELYNIGKDVGFINLLLDSAKKQKVLNAPKNAKAAKFVCTNCTHSFEVQDPEHAKVFQYCSDCGAKLKRVR